MNADANTAHRTSLIVCTCGIEFRLIDRPIIENATIRIRAFEPLIKEFHVAKKTAHFSSKRSENDDDDDDDDALSSIPRKWMDARARRTKGLADACISQIFLTVERSRGPDPLFFSLFFSRESPFLLAQLFFSFDSRESRADALAALAIS